MKPWRDTLLAVPRHRFIPDMVWVRDDDGFMRLLHRADDPQRWRELCDADDGAEQRGFLPTSSTSALFIMLSMLDALDVQPGMRVLEIGTGTGYNAAVLAERPGRARFGMTVTPEGQRIWLDSPDTPVTVIDAGRRWSGA